MTLKIVVVVKQVAKLLQKFENPVLVGSFMDFNGSWLRDQYMSKFYLFHSSRKQLFLLFGLIQILKMALIFTKCIYSR